MEFELENIENYEFDNSKIYFMAGVMKAYTNLDLEVIFKFLNSIYSNKINEANIKEIEDLIIKKKLGDVKRLLDNNRCGKCNKLENELIRFKCKHCFHVDCIKLDIIDSIQNMGKYNCLICKVTVTNIEKYHSRIEIAINDYKNAHFYNTHPNHFPCSKCKTPCLADGTGHCKCSNCNIIFCVHCQKISKSCSCTPLIKSYG